MSISNTLLTAIDAIHDNSFFVNGSVLKLLSFCSCGNKTEEYPVVIPQTIIVSIGAQAVMVCLSSGENLLFVVLLSMNRSSFLVP